MWREAEVQVYPERIHDAELQEARAKGMVGKYIVDVGWEQAFAVLNVYGEAGGANANKAATEALLLAGRREMRNGPYQPNIVMGDFNATPHKLGPVRDWINEEAWTDVGLKADWWGGTANLWTCHANVHSKKSRIDGVLVDAVALASIHAFEVEKRVHIPRIGCSGSSSRGTPSRRRGPSCTSLDPSKQRSRRDGRSSPKTWRRVKLLRPGKQRLPNFRDIWMTSSTCLRGFQRGEKER